MSSSRGRGSLPSAQGSAETVETMHREPRRWRTPFGRFVHSIGVDALTRRLSAVGQPVTGKAVYNWLAGDHSPRPQCAEAMVEISRGRLALEDVYAHRASLRVLVTGEEAAPRPRR